MTSHHNYQSVKDLDLTHLALSFKSHQAGKDDMHHVSISSKKGDEEGPIYISLEGVVAGPSRFEQSGNVNLTIDQGDFNIIQDIELKIKAKVIEYLSTHDKTDIANRINQATFKDRLFGDHIFHLKVDNLTKLDIKTKSNPHTAYGPLKLSQVEKPITITVHMKIDHLYVRRDGNKDECGLIFKTLAIIAVDYIANEEE